ncbi:MAG: hypothetical protein IJM17_08725 [Firmicutes bacterium]|nr:hypothetical protein [Bacillota bacterium]
MKIRSLLISLSLVLLSAGLSFADIPALPPEPEKKTNYLVPIAVIAVCVIAIVLIIKKRKK